MTIRRLLAAAALSALAALPLVSGTPRPAEAANILLCAASITNQAGPRTFGGTGSAVPSGTLYTLNGRGCTLVAQGDVGYFLSQGFTQVGNTQSSVFSTGVLTGTTAVQMPSLPAGAVIREFIVQNTTANAVTGGVNIGTTSGGADVVSALTCGASCLTFVADAALLKRIFSATAQQALFVVAQTAGNNANLTITVVYNYF